MTDLLGKTRARRGLNKRDRQATAVALAARGPRILVLDAMNNRPLTL